MVPDGTRRIAQLSNHEPTSGQQCLAQIVSQARQKRVGHRDFMLAQLPWTSRACAPHFQDPAVRRCFWSWNQESFNDQALRPPGRSVACSGEFSWHCFAEEVR